MKACTIWNAPATTSSAPMKMTPAIVNAMTSNQAIAPSTSWSDAQGNEPSPARARAVAGTGSCKVAHGTDVNDETAARATSCRRALVSAGRGAYASGMTAAHSCR